MKLWFGMLHMCVCMHYCFIENHPIQILEDGHLISEVVLSHLQQGHFWFTGQNMVDCGGQRLRQG
jgi:hypothetical protein